MKHPRDSLAGAAWGKLFPALSPTSWLSDSGRLWGPCWPVWGDEEELIIQTSRCKPPASSQKEGGSWSEQAQGGRSQLFYSRRTCLRSQSEHKTREGPAPTSALLRVGRHGTPGLDRTQAFELSPARPREAPFGPTCPYRDLPALGRHLEAMGMTTPPEHLDPNLNAFFPLGEDL